MNNKPKITYDDFLKLELGVGVITSVEDVPDSRKLLKFSVDIGSETRTILGGFKKTYGDNKESLVGRQVVVLANLESKEIAGSMSEGMILAATGDHELPIFLTPETTDHTKAGSEVR
ncbi:MAG: methionine--tRNA ligase [Candidatus Vogelbacteria bacterium CG10_big_fil_rev_8_21_14_0_10_45_14]|uniref:Methionine--tRNA ligase n=1 Tax=Candidatus Vogelbacteria bacterium CG10_big_fil_rev_8_21_14_0_10_45_14 TaxID=1975042 RepID=A0A2H0RKL3_9BACT|nr:MAG: methionine--tRNA ligase [Candidatus Vogelbacteria bacterium CG10_big_fil_rev_8_21_14_0_10_45_14]